MKRARNGSEPPRAIISAHGPEGQTRLARVIDLKAARQDPEGYRAALARRGAAADFDALLEVDGSWRSLTERAEALRAAQRVSSKGKPTADELEQLRGLRDELAQAQAELAQGTEQRDALLAQVPAP